MQWNEQQNGNFENCIDYYFKNNTVNISVKIVYITILKIILCKTHCSEMCIISK